jgi:hypothetical protein
MELALDLALNKFRRMGHAELKDVLIELEPACGYQPDRFSAKELRFS